MVYYALDWPTFLDIQQKAKCICTLTLLSEVHSYLLVTARDVILIDERSLTITLCFTRPDKCINSFGESCGAIWAASENTILLTTSKNFLLSFRISEPLIASYLTPSAPFSLTYIKHTALASPPTSISHYNDSLLCSCRSGIVYLLNPDGGVQISWTLSQLSFYHDAEHSRVRRSSTCDLFCQTLVSAPTLDGVVAVLSSGEVALLRMSNITKEELAIEGILFERSDNPTVVAVNHRFRMVAVGCSNSEVALYRVDETTGAIFLHERLRISNKECPDAASLVGAVSHVTWSPDGYALAVAWSNCGWALWSAFGGLLHTSLGERVGLSTQVKLTHLCWASSGYQLVAFLSFTNPCDFADTSAFDSLHLRPQTPTSSEAHLVAFHLAHSSLTRNPTTDNHQHILLQSNQFVFYVPRKHLTVSHVPQCVSLPNVYMKHHWPLKYVAMDSSGSRIAISGARGIAHYNCATSRWFVFGSEIQERSFEVCGGLVWWQRFICFACSLATRNVYEIRTYPSFENLDERFASTHRLQHQERPILTDCVGSHVTCLTAASRVYVFGLRRKSGDVASDHYVQIIPTQIIDLANLILFPQCVSRLCLSPISFNFPVPISTTGPHRKDSLTPTPSATQSRENFPHTLLINYAGHLFILQPTLTAAEDSSLQNSNAELTGRPLSLTPFLVAYNVEFVWSMAMGVQPQGDGVRNRENQPGSLHAYLHDSLWLYCGSRGLHVWLPLPKLHNLSSSTIDGSIDSCWSVSPTGEKDREMSLTRTVLSPGFAPRRIMIALELDECMHPQTILFEQAVLVGLSNDFHRPLHLRPPTTSEPTAEQFYSILPYGVVQLETHAFLHRIIQQLLRKNLAAHALQLARAYQDLPHFHRLLEWLLHEVLEFEATTKTPIPDPLLPQVLAFLQEFPYFLETLAQCARKTEVARWPHLFTAVGRRPRDLFELCLDCGNLDAAVAYLIVLQSSEPIDVSQECTLRLIHLALESSNWNLLRELMRFLNAIDPMDLKYSPDSQLAASKPGNPVPRKSIGLLQQIDQLVQSKFATLYSSGHLVAMAELHANFPLHTTFGRRRLSAWIADQNDQRHQIDDWPASFQQLYSSLRDEGDAGSRPSCVSSPSDVASFDVHNSAVQEKLHFLYTQLLNAQSFEWACLVAVIGYNRIGLFHAVSKCAELSRRRETPFHLLLGLGHLASWTCKHLRPYHDFIASLLPDVRDLANQAHAFDSTASVRESNAHETQATAPERVPLYPQTTSCTYPVVRKTTEFVQLELVQDRFSDSESSGPTTTASIFNGTSPHRSRSDSMLVLPQSMEDLPGSSRASFVTPGYVVPRSPDVDWKMTSSLFSPLLVSPTLQKFENWQNSDHVIDATVDTSYQLSSSSFSGCVLS